MLGLAAPVLIEQLLNLLVGLVDTYLAGNYLPGDAPLAAIGLMAYTLWLLSSLFATVAIGATAVVSRMIGAGDRDTAVRATNQAFVLGLAFAAAVTTLAVAGGASYVRAMQLENEAAEMARNYLGVVAWVAPAIMIQQVGIACLRGAGDTISGLWAMTLVNVVNVCVSYALVTGWGPFSPMGIEGLAYGTACGYVVGALAILVLLTLGRAGLHLRPRYWKPDPALLRRIVRIGLPGGIDMLAVLSCHLAFVAIINTMGAVAAASHALGIRIEAMAYLPAIAFQVAAATMAGQYLGAGKPALAARSVWMALWCCGSLMVAAGLVFVLAGRPLANAFLGQGQAETADLAVTFLKITALTMPSLAITIVLTGGLRGAGDTRWPLAFTFIGFLGVRIPGACLLAWEEIHLPLVDVTLYGAGWGVVGAWWAMLADILLRSVLVAWRFAHGGWQSTRV